VTASVAGAPAAPAPPSSLPAPPLLVSAGSGGTTEAPREQNPEDYVPAAEEPPLDSSRHVRRGTAEGVPLYQDVAASPGSQIPQLRLDLHVYSARPEDRFVMINMHKLREGDSLADGVRVDSITTDGAVLSYNGSRFLLPRD
jgi:general secretion pathway protein B